MLSNTKNHITGMASEYLILSLLYRQNFNAYLTIGNAKAIDIIVRLPEDKNITIDVKSVRGHSSVPVNNIKINKNHFIVVVIYNKKFHSIEYNPDIYIIPSFEIEIICEHYKKEKRLLKKKISKYKNKWDLLK